MEKGQLSIEFFVMVGMAVMLLIVFVSVSSDLIVENSKERYDNAMNDLVYSVQSEIILGSRAEAGYVRNFTIPESVDKYDFSINNTQGELFVEYDNSKKEVVLPIPNVTGIVKKGMNRIRNEQGVVIIEN
jgi:hypothetical protein